MARIQVGHVTTFHDPEAIDTSLNALFEDRENNLWVGFFGKGLARFHDGHFEHLTSTGRVSAIAQSSDGALWVAWDGDGISRILHGITTHFSTANGLPNDHVMCLYVDSDGDVWVGTASGGLSRIRGSYVMSWTPDQGLPDSTVGSIIEDNESNLWVGGDYGISRISKSELSESGKSHTYTLHPQQFGTEDGLRSRETVYGSMPSEWKDARGRLWFATIKGAAVIDPAHIPVNTVTPPVWIESVVFDSKTILPLNGMRLGRGSGNLEFSFTAPGFVAPQHEVFRYRLIGFDRDWISAGT